MQILLIRHGKTAGNLQRRYVGRTDESLLEEEKIRLQTGRLYEGEKPLVFSPDTVYVSPLIRCRQTAECLFGDVKQKVWMDFRETDFGDFEYKNYEELKDNPDYQAWIDSGGMLAFPNGESGASFRKRCRLAWNRCLEDMRAEGQEKAAVVCHGGTIMSIMSATAGRESSFYDWQVSNGCGYLLNMEDDRGILDSYGEIFCETVLK